MRDVSDSYPATSGTGPAPTGVLAELLGWTAHLPFLPLDRAVPELVLRLDRLRTSSLDLETRYRMLRALKGAVLRVASALPKGQPAGGPALGGLSLEQRLYDGMTCNCKRLLQNMDRVRYGYGEAGERHRYWVIRNDFRFIGRQVIYAVQNDRPWPKGVWQDLHDLYVYLVVRGQHGETRIVSGGRDFDSEQVYKRLLVVGLVADLVDRRRLDGSVLARLGPIADNCSLVEPDVMLGEHGLTLVEVSCDRPTRLKTGRLEDPFRGWVLRTPADLEILLLNLDPFQQHPATAVAA
jgi:hypothetical protein